jgi:hypothetical protein
MAKSGGRVNEDTGKVSKGWMPKGHIDPYGEATSFKDGPLRILRKK